MLPGAGQLYAGRSVRAVGVFLVNYAGQHAAYSLGALISSSWGPMAMLTSMLLLHGAAAWDAWRVAELAAAAEAAEPPPAVAGAAWRAGWVLVRLPWILGIVAVYGFYFLILSTAGPNSNKFSLAVVHLLLAGVFLGLAGFASAHTFLVASGRRPYPLGALQAEISGSCVIYAIIGLMLAIAWPMFSDMHRRSGEGAMKGRLATIRMEAKVFETKHGRPPGTLDELVADKRSEAPYPLVTELWPTKSNRWHQRADAGFVLLPGRTTSDSGLWALDPGTTTFFIDCTHTDSKGSVWTAY